MNNARSNSLSMLVITILFVGVAAAQHEMPAGMTHEQHLAKMKKEAEIKKRGDVAMGFDQDKAAHHFLIGGDGGSIQVENNNAEDTGSRDLIRRHLKTISKQFATGDFSAPFATHEEIIPGVNTMQRLKSEISYAYEDRPQGAIVRIKSTNPEAVQAVHEFLQYQVREHATGDPLTVQK